MWIIQKPETLGTSSSQNVNFLFKKNNIYVMDNHLSASWCWLQEVNIKKEYEFIHIDRHYDLINQPKVIIESIVEKQIDLTTISFSEYIELEQVTGENLSFKVPLFRWDNYIHHINNLYPLLLNKTSFITKKIGAYDKFVQNEYEIEEFITQFEDWIESSKHKFIFNLDIDYFYTNINGKMVQLYSNEIIERLAYLIKKNLNRISVLTIALSPECCGSWENAFAIYKIFDEILEINMEI